MGTLEIFLVALGVILLLKLWDSNIHIGGSIEPRRLREGDDDDEQKPDPPLLEP